MGEFFSPGALRFVVSHGSELPATPGLESNIGSLGAAGLGGTKARMPSSSSFLSFLLFK